MAVDALHRGAENFLTKPVDLSHLAAAAERALEKASLRRMNRYLSDRRGGGPDLLLGTSAADARTRRADLAARGSDRTTALIVGESGSGKGRVAELMHAQSPRSAKPFVQVNCAALTAESLDSELFGVEVIDRRNGRADAARTVRDRRRRHAVPRRDRRPRPAPAAQAAARARGKGIPAPRRHDRDRAERPRDRGDEQGSRRPRSPPGGSARTCTTGCR